MPTTSNFGWTTPADTDLVKDGAAAIRTLGNGVDASLVDLKGGTTGQVLSKATNTDLDYTWITPNVGDITEVQAGTGISVASGTGPIPVVTNTVATEFDAKGDLVVGTGSDTFDRLAVGTNGHILVADSAETTGLKWQAPASASGPAFSAYRDSSTQSISATTWTKVQLNAEAFDTDSCFDPTTNYRFTPNKSGYYLFTGSIWLSGSTNWNLAIYKNGADASTFFNTSTIPTLGGGTLLYANGSSDYFEAYVYATGGGTVQNIGGSSTAIVGVWIRS